RLSCTGAISRREHAFFLQGPMKLGSHKELQFWREAPRIGLTGVAEIEIGEQGITAERVAYDLNLASDILRRALALHSSFSHAPEKRSQRARFRKPIEPTLEIRSNVSKQPFVITPKNCPRPLKVLGEQAAVLHAKLHKFTPLRHETLMTTQFSKQSIAVLSDGLPKLRSGLVWRLVCARDDAGKERIRKWLIDLDDAQLQSGLGLTVEDIAVLRTGTKTASPLR